MRRLAVVLSAVTISLGAVTTVAGTAVAGPPDNDPYTLSNGHANPQAGQMMGVVPAHDASGQAHGHGGGGGGSGPNLIYHNGPVRASTTTVVPIFWGTSWTSSSAIVAGLSTFYSGVGGSNYLNTTTEYTQAGGAHVSNSVAYGTPLIDNSAAPSRAPSTSAVLAEVQKEVPNPDPNTYYPVYIDQGRGSAGYCAWHSYGPASNGQNYIFGFFFNLTGDSGCSPGAGGANEPPAVVSLANVSGHELSEMVTDVQLNAWYDSSGAENSDKCAWTFPNTTSQWPTFGGITWKIQGNWSNANYTAGRGYTDPTYGFQQGCIDTA